ncbi:HalOD1 output domain-containing protein [Haladaptatus sp. CMAA 1911]|uniref:HalOD1 output domain-containing protein n=1 Tax=unclassified Haladaptatus TaxID=2622732 RepID=UPI0037551D84
MSDHERYEGGETATAADDRGHGWTHPDSMCVQVIDAVVETMGTDTAEITPLYDYIDPDALNDLFKPSENGRCRRGGRVEFRMESHVIRISSDGDIEVRPVAD